MTRTLIRALGLISTGCTASPRETLSGSDSKCLKPGPRFHVGFTLLFTFALRVFSAARIANSSET
jgi:hypothetical protein